MTDYEDQRIKGASLILARVEELARKADLTVLLSQWKHGRVMTQRSAHTLSVQVESKQCEAHFSDEQLVDFPAGKGISITEAAIRALVAGLKV